MIEKHHIIFKSQQGLDFEMNYKYLTSEEHRGNNGPHMCRKTDLAYKKEMQKNLEKTLIQKYYTTKDLIEILGLKERQANKAFRKIEGPRGIKRKDAIKKLMGDRFYL